MRLGRPGSGHDPVPGRDPPVHQVPAGRAAAVGRDRAADPHRCHHREPVLRGQPAADVPLDPLPAPAPRSRLTDRARPTRPRGRGRDRRRRGLAHLVDRAGGDGRHLLTSLEVAVALGPARRVRREADPRDPRRRRGRAGRIPGPLRPRRPLRRDLGLHQVDPGLGPDAAPALAGPDDRGRGGPPVHRPASGHLGVRGHRDGRSAGHRRRRRRGPRRRVRRLPRGRHQPGPGHGAPGAGARSPTRSYLGLNRALDDVLQQARSARSPSTSATRPTGVRPGSGTGRGIAIPTTSSGDGSISSICPMSWPDPLLRPGGNGAEGRLADRWNERTRRSPMPTIPATRMSPHERPRAAHRDLAPSSSGCAAVLARAVISASLAAIRALDEAAEEFRSEAVPALEELRVATRRAVGCGGADRRSGRGGTDPSASASTPPPRPPIKCAHLAGHQGRCAGVRHPTGGPTPAEEGSGMTTPTPESPHPPCGPCAVATVSQGRTSGVGGPDEAIVLARRGCRGGGIGHRLGPAEGAAAGSSPWPRLGRPSAGNAQRRRGRPEACVDAVVDGRSTMREREAELREQLGQRPPSSHRPSPSARAPNRFPFSSGWPVDSLCRHDRRRPPITHGERSPSRLDRVLHRAPAHLGAVGEPDPDPSVGAHVHQLGHDAVRPVLPGGGAGAVPTGPRHVGPEVRPSRGQAQRPRRHRPVDAPPVVLRDARATSASATTSSPRPSPGPGSSSPRCSGSTVTGSG